MLMEDHYGKLLCANVEELEGAIAASNHELVLVDLGPGQIIDCIVRIESALESPSSAFKHILMDMRFHGRIHSNQL